MIQKYPKKKINNRLTYKIVCNFLNALIEDKVCLENILSPEVMDRIKDSILSKGLAYEKHSENKLFFDKELESLFDEKTKNIILKLNESNYKFIT